VPLVLSMVRVVKQPFASPPPPPLAPGAAMITIHKTVVEMTASGDVQDYDEAAKSGLATKFADLAGVDPNEVTVEVKPASVVIVVTIVVADATAATSLSASVASTLSDTSTASSFTGLTITSAPTVSVITEVQELTPAENAARLGGGDDVPLIIVLPAALGGAAVLLTCVLIGLYLRRGKRAGKGEASAAKAMTPPVKV